MAPHVEPKEEILVIGDIGTGDLPAIVASVIAIAACVAGLLRALQHFQSRRNGGITVNTLGIPTTLQLDKVLWTGGGKR